MLTAPWSPFRRWAPDQSQVLPKRPRWLRTRIGEGAGGEGGALRAAFHAELRVEPGYVVLPRLLGQEQPLADLPVGQPLADQLQDLALLVGQSRQRVASRPL